MKSKIIIVLTVVLCFISFRAASEPVLIDCVLAVVNDKVITLSELLLREKKIYGKEEAPPDLSFDAKMDLREKILQDLIDERILIDKAEELELNPSDVEITERIDQIRMSNGMLTTNALEESLARDGMTLDDLKTQISEDISLMRIRHQIAFRDINITEKEILDYYSKNWTGYKEGERVTISHILIKLPEDSTQKEEQEILKRLADIKKAWEEGTAFEELAKKYSEDSSAEAGGSLGKFYIKDLIPQFYEAIKGVEPKNVAGPVKTQAGYHLLFLEDRRDSGLDKESPIWKKIEETLLQRKRADQYGTWIKRFRKNATVEINKEALSRCL